MVVTCRVKTYMITIITKVKYRKIQLLFLFLLFQALNLLAQKSKDIQIVNGEVSFKLDSIYYTTELRIGFNQRLIKKSVFSRISNKLVEEFYMNSDTSVCFVRYDDNMNVTGIGVFMVDRDNPADYNLLSVPDMVNDPYGDKGLTQDWFCKNCIWPLKKEGIWIENSSIGNYSGGLRTGPWEFGKSMIHINRYEPMSIITDSISIYRNGNIQNTVHVGSHFNDESKKMAGRWYIEQNRTDSSLFLCRRPYNRSELGFIDFYSSYSYQDNYFPSTQGDIGQWEVKGKILILAKAGKKSRYKLDDINESAVILRKVY
jgi:hypothetical protein